MLRQGEGGAKKVIYEKTEKYLLIQNILKIDLAFSGILPPPKSGQ